MDGARLKKKMESDLSDLEMQVDVLNKNNAELMKTVKKMQQQIKVQSRHGFNLQDLSLFRCYYFFSITIFLLWCSEITVITYSNYICMYAFIYSV